MLKVENITLSYYEGHPILSDVKLQVGDGERMALLGRNGAGKTSFANAIFGLIPHIKGKISYRGVDILSLSLENIKALGLGYFMQGAPVFPQLSVKENLILASGGKRDRKFESLYRSMYELLPFFHDPGFTDSQAGSLSGGERTQLVLAMCMINHPSLLLLDEPFAGLSPANVRVVLQALRAYHEKLGASVILIAQDRQLASAFCDTQYLIREGQIIKE